MKKFPKTLLLIATLFLLMFVFPNKIFAQAPDGDPDSSIPIDGGISLLIAAGIGYGIKKGKDHKKKKSTAIFE